MHCNQGMYMLLRLSCVQINLLWMNKINSEHKNLCYLYRQVQLFKMRDMLAASLLHSRSSFSFLSLIKTCINNSIKCHSLINISEIAVTDIPRSEKATWPPLCVSLCIKSCCIFSSALTSRCDIAGVSWWSNMRTVRLTETWNTF